jgi:hypothetical protein
VLSLRGGALLLVLVVLPSCGKRVAPEECSALLDRYVEKLVGSDRPGVSAGELVRMQAEARATAKTDPAFRDCPNVVSRRQMDCAMRAETVDRMEICLN